MRFHAKALGIGYIALDNEDAKLIISGVGSLHQMIEAESPSYDPHRPPLVTTIDSSIRKETMKSLIAMSQKTFQLPLSLQGNLELLETFESPHDAHSEEAPSKSARDSLLAITIVRSPHGQLALWPVLEILRNGSLRPVELPSFTANLDLILERIQSFAGEKKLVGALTFLASHQGEILRREWGLTPISLWSEHSSHTTVAEQMVRALVDLPLGQTQSIAEDEFYLEEIVDLDEHARRTSERLGREIGNLTELFIDPTRPFLHLFARNPKLKVSYLSESINKVKIAVYASNESDARAELEHAKDFMAGFDL